jgi:hypothetical protein
VLPADIEKTYADIHAAKHLKSEPQVTAQALGYVRVSSRRDSFWLVGLAALAALVPLPLAQCGVDKAGVQADGGAEHDGNPGIGVVNGDGGSGVNGGDGSLSGTEGGRNSSSGATGSGTSGGASSGGHAASGTSTDAASSGADANGGGGSSTQEAGVLCTSTGIPPGCVQCLSGADCPTIAPHCLNGTCVTCVTSADCGGGSTPVCWPSDNMCHAACSNGGMTCPTGAGQPSVCDPTTGACVGCLTTNDCPTSAPVCDSVTMQCVQCQTDSNCSGTTPHCDSTSQTCVACAKNADCTDPAMPVCRFMPPSARAMPPTLGCQPGCTSSSQCTDAGATACDSNGYCVECVDNSTCSGATPICNTTIPYAFGTYETCVPCLPAPYGSDAGSQGCDGGTCMPIGGRGPPTGFVCQ